MLKQQGEFEICKVQNSFESNRVSFASFQINQKKKIEKIRKGRRRPPDHFGPGSENGHGAPTSLPEPVPNSSFLCTDMQAPPRRHPPHHSFFLKSQQGTTKPEKSPRGQSK
jgi:hypothetical protein